MKRNFLFIILVILISSCEKDDINYILDDFIQAGQITGNGIEYTDLKPDINCTIIDPWEKTDTTINLDLNNDGIDDFSINGTMCHPSMLGADCEYFSIVPLLSNEICINPDTHWLDTIPYLDTINLNNDWSIDEALIYSYYWDINGNTSTNGYWKEVLTSHKYYIGVKILKDETTLYGWIGMNRDPSTWSLSYIITDYAIRKEYEE